MWKHNVLSQQRQRMNMFSNNNENIAFLTPILHSTSSEALSVDCMGTEFWQFKSTGFSEYHGQSWVRQIRIIRSPGLHVRMCGRHQFPRNLSNCCLLAGANVNLQHVCNSSEELQRTFHSGKIRHNCFVWECVSYPHHRDAVVLDTAMSTR